MRSYDWIDSASICFATGASANFGDGPIPSYRLFELSAKNGWFAINRETDFFIAPGQEQELTGIKIRASRKVAVTQKILLPVATWGITVRRTLLGGVTYSIPLWFLSVTAGAAGTLLWMQRPYRFTLRGALIATTLIVVILGMGTALSR